MRSLLCAFILLASSSMLVSAGYMDTLFEWKYVDYLWQSEAKRQEAIDSGAYDFSRVLPMDVDKSKGITQKKYNLFKDILIMFQTCIHLILYCHSEREKHENLIILKVEFYVEFSTFK